MLSMPTNIKYNFIKKIRSLGYYYEPFLVKKKKEPYEFKLLTSSFLKRAKAWIKKFSQCNNISQNENLQTEILHLIRLFNTILNEHYDRVEHDARFYDDFAFGYYVLVDNSKSMQQVIGFDRNEVRICSIYFYLNFLMPKRYSVEEIVESVIERLIYLLNELTEQKYDLRTKEGFYKAFRSFLKRVLAKGYNYQQLIDDYSNLKLSDYAIVPAHLLPLKKALFAFSVEIKAQEQNNNKLQALLSLIDKPQNLNLIINKVCPISLETLALNKVCVVCTENKKNHKMIIDFYRKYDLLEHFIREWSKKNRDNEYNIFADKEIFCPKKNNITTIKFLGLNDLIQLLEANPKPLEDIQQIKC